MNYKNIYFDDLGVTAEFTTFAPEGKTTERHVMLHVEPRGELFGQQIQRLQDAEEKVLALQPSLKKVFKRYFFSDIVNQAPLVPTDDSCTTCFIQQPPLDGSKVAVWIYLQEAEDVSVKDGVAIVRNNGYEHYWQMGRYETQGNSYTQTQVMLCDYEEMLEKHGMTIERNCIRTWFFVRDVDILYKGMVEARKANFFSQGMREDTHYIASTGIGGVPQDTKSILVLDTYAIKGIANNQQQYLYARTHLNPTSEYGVTFERGVSVEFGDRKHLYISGTASINNKGEVVHVGDIVKQTHRMWENVETLLAEGGAEFGDVTQIVVYLRDGADYDVVRKMFEEKFPETPFVITLAPVCRPQWLIEMECMAIIPNSTREYRDF